MRARFNVEVNPRIRSLREVFKLEPRDMREMLVPVDDQFTRNEKRLFSTEGRSGGDTWPSLSPAYAKQKRRKFPGRKIMQRTGKLRKSLVNKGDPAHLATFRLRPRAVLSVGTLNVGAAWHGPKRGNPLANPRVPVRDVLAHTRRQEGRYRRLVADYLIEQKLGRVARAMVAWRSFNARRRYGIR